MDACRINSEVPISEEQVFRMKGERKSKLSGKLYRIFPQLPNLNADILYPSKAVLPLEVKMASPDSFSGNPTPHITIKLP